MSNRLMCVVGLLCLAGGAGAATVNMNFTGVGMYRTGLNLSDNGVAKNGVTAAELRWTAVSSNYNPIQTGQNFKTFCTDLFQYAGNGVMEVAPLSSAPVPGPGMGTIRAGLIQKLYAAKFSESDDSNDKAAAFQLAIWEIIYDDSFNAAAVGSGRVAAGLGIDGGDFMLTNQTTTFKNLVNGFLDAAFAETTPMNLIALVSPNSVSGAPRQDQIYMAPLPTATALAGVGLLGLGSLRRRRA